MQHKMDKQLQELVDKYLNKTATESETAVVEEFFASFSDREDLLDQLDSTERDEVKHRIHGEVLSRVRRQPGRVISLRRHISKIAVAVLFLIGISLSIYVYSDRSVGQEFSVKNGEQRQIILADGTKVILNGSSTLVYPSSFANGHTREVTLRGEAYFDVAKNPKKPFLIHTDRMEIRVLGTAFNVRDYKDELTAETSLIHGKVQIHKVGEEETFFLKPNEKFVLAPTSPDQQTENTGEVTIPNKVLIKPLTVSDDGAGAIETEWMHRRITIQEESLQQIARRLERMYGIEIHISNPRKALQTYSATFDNEQLDDVLKALQAVTPFSYKKGGAENLEIY